MSGRLSIMSLNLRFGLAQDGENSWHYRKKAFPEIFKQFQPDFFCFQEANDFQADFLQELLPAYVCIGRRQPAPPNDGLHRPCSGELAQTKGFGRCKRGRPRSADLRQPDRKRNSCPGVS